MILKMYKNEEDLKKAREILKKRKATALMEVFEMCRSLWVGGESSLYGIYVDIATGDIFGSNLVLALDMCSSIPNLVGFCVSSKQELGMPKFNISTKNLMEYGKKQRYPIWFIGELMKAYSERRMSESLMESNLYPIRKLVDMVVEEHREQLYTCAIKIYNKLLISSK